MTTLEYGRHARSRAAWAQADADARAAAPAQPVDLSHGSVFEVDDEQGSGGAPPTLLTSVRRLLNRRIG